MEKNVFRLKEIMQEKGISRDALAQGMGVAPATISNISTGRVYPSVKFLMELAEYLDVDIREMFYPTKQGNLKQNDLNLAIEEIKNGLEKLQFLKNG